MKGSMDTGACKGVKDAECAEIVYRKDKMIRGEGQAVLEEKMDALDLNKNEIDRFLGCKQTDKTDVKRVVGRAMKEIRKRLDHLTELNVNDKNLMKAINCRVISVAGYVMNVCNLGKSDLDKLDMTCQKVYYGEKDFMEDSQAMRDYIQREVKVAED